LTEIFNFRRALNRANGLRDENEEIKNQPFRPFSFTDSLNAKYGIPPKAVEQTEQTKDDLETEKLVEEVTEAALKELRREKAPAEMTKEEKHRWAVANQFDNP
jgi:hypothetical protein